MMSCKEATKLISQAMETDLDFWTRMGLKLHLFVCRLCSRFEKQVNFIGDTLRIFRNDIEKSELMDIQLTQEARERLKFTLRENNTDT